MHKNLLGQKISVSKNFWNLYSSGFKTIISKFGCSNFVDPKKMFDKLFLDPKFCIPKSGSVQNSFRPKIWQQFLVQNFFGSNIFLDPEFVPDPNFFQTYDWFKARISSEPRILYGPRISFGLNILFRLKSFQAQIFSDSGFFIPKVLRTNIFWPEFFRTQTQALQAQLSQNYIQTKHFSP